MKTAQILSNNAFIRPINGVTTINVRNYIYAEVGAIFTEGTGSVVNKKFPTVQSAKVDINNYYLPMAGSQMGNAGYRKK
jgi:hypothetical protein